jgi:hypothetical protein
MKKIALCLSGGLRNFKDTFYSFEHFLLRNHNIDVFFFGLENKEGIDKNTYDLIKLYNPKDLKINSEKYYNDIPCNFNLRSPYYAFYNIFKCNELKCSYENKYSFKYDYVIRARTDFFWFRHITENEFLIANDNILFPKEWAFKEINYFARSDIYAIGNSVMMDIYSNLFENIFEYNKELNFHPESYCGLHLLKNNISNIEIDRHVIFEYPSERIEKFIHPYKFIKYFSESDIFEEGEFIAEASNRRKNF